MKKKIKFLKLIKKRIKPIFASFYKLKATTLLIVAVFLAIITTLLWKLALSPKKVEAGWWNDVWHYRRAITISSGSSAASDFQVKINNYDTSTDITDGKMQETCGDIRFTSAAGVELPYWVVAGTCNSSTNQTDIWVKVDSIPAAGGTTIYMYYGNPSAEDGSDRDNTFDVLLLGTFSQQFSDANIGPNHGLSSDRTNNFYVSHSAYVNRFNTSWSYQQQYSGLDIYTGLCYDDGRNRFYGIDWTNKQWSTFTTSFSEISPNDQTLGDEPIDCATDSTYVYTNHRNGLIKRNAISNNASSSFNMDTLSGFDWGGQGLTYAYGYLFAGTTNSCGANGNRIYVIDIDNWSSPTIVTYWDSSGHTLTEVAGITWKDKYIYQTDRTLDYANEWQGPLKTMSTEPSAGSPGSEEQGTSPIAYWSFDEGYSTTVHNQMEKNGENGLISWWKFDDASSGTTPVPQDTMEINDGSWSGNASYTSTAKIGNAATFDGTGDYIDVGTDDSLKINNHLTISAWIKRGATGTTQTIAGNYYWGGSGATSGGYYFFITSSNTLRLDAGDGVNADAFPGTGTITDTSSWHHVAVTFDTGVATFYIDGVYDSAFTTDASVYSMGNWIKNFIIGAYNNGASSFFNGQIDSLKVFSQALSAGEIQAEYNSLHGHMLNMDPSSDWVDGVQPNPDQKPMGKASNFDGSNDYVEVDHGTPISPTSDDISISGWFKPDSTFDNTADYNQGIVDKGDYQFFLDKSDGKAKWVVNDNTAEAFSALGSTPFGGTVRALAVWNGDLYAGGEFSNGGGDGDADHIAKWDGSSWSWPSNQGLGDNVYALTVWEGNLYAGGYFTNAGGDGDADYIAKWDGSSWSWPTGQAFSGTIYTLSVWNGELYVGGFFYNGGGDPDADKIAKWDGSSWSWPSGQGLTVDDTVYALTVWEGNLYAGGYFLNAGGDGDADHIAKWDGSSWSWPTGQGLSLNVLALTVWGGNLYAGGIFTDAGGDGDADRIAKWDGSSWSWPSGQGLGNYVRALAVWNGDLYAGGEFANAGGDGDADYIAKWGGSSWSWPSGQAVGGIVRTLAVWKGDLYAGGAFNNAGGDANADKIAKWGTSNNKTVESTTSSWASGTWHHFTATYNHSNMKLYVNGILESTVSTGVTLEGNSLDLYIGKTYGSQMAGGSGELFDGDIDELKIYDIALDADQVEIQYNRGFSAAQNVGEVSNKGDPPKGFWKFDEGSAYTAFDSSGSENHGSLGTGNSAPEWAQGKIGKALEFDGSNDYVDCGNDSSLNFNDTSFTFGGWFYSHDITTYSRGMGKVQSSADTYQLFFGNTANKIGYYLRDSGTQNTGNVNSSSDFSSNTWYHVMVVVDQVNEESKLYVNGILEASASVATLEDISPTGNLYIGKSFSADYFDGLIDHVKIYDYARTIDQIHRDMATGSPIAYWSFDEGTGTTIHNQQEKNGENGLISWWKFDDASSGVSPAPQDEMELHDGTWSNNAAYTGNSKVGNAANLPGVSESGDGVFLLTGAEAASYQDDNKSFSYSLWFDAGSDSGGDSAARIISRDCSDYFCLNMDQSGGTGLTHYYSDTENSGVQSFSDQTSWHHSVGVWDQVNNDFLWYLDGELFYSDTSIAAFNTSTMPIVLGGNTEGDGDISGNEFQGNMDSVKIYNRALSASEIQAEYNSLHGHLVNYDSGTLTWQPDATDGIDTYVNSRSPDSNSGTATTNWTGKGYSDENRRSLIKFDLSSIPTGSTIHSATMHLWITNYDAINTTSNFYRTTSDWDEGTVTWNTGHPTYDSGTIHASFTTSTYRSLSEKTASVTNIIQSWVNGTYSNYGFYAIGNESSTWRRAYFASSDNATASQRPKLVVQYTPPSSWADGARPNPNQKPMGKALVLDGINDYVDMGDVLNLDLPVSVSGWVYRANSSAPLYIFSSDVYSTNYRGFNVTARTDGAISASYGNGGTGETGRRTKTSSTGLVPAGKWTHIAGIIRGATDMDLYIDGIDVGGTYSGSGGSMVHGTYPAKIGPNWRDSDYSEGRIDEVKVYNYSLTADEIKVEYNRGHALVLGVGASESDPNIGSPVGWWKLDEGSAYTAFDSSGGNYNGVLTNMDSASDWVSGKIGKALDFDGSNDYVNMGNVLNFERTDAFSISAWIKTDNHSTYRMIVDKRDADSPYRGYRFDIDQNDGSLNFYLSHDAGTSETISVDGSTFVCDDVWHHVVATYDGSSAASGVNFYVDGVIESTTVNTDNVSDTILSSTEFHIGATENGGNPFTGIIDNVKVWDEELSVAEVAWEYDQGKPVYHWSFDENDGVLASNASSKSVPTDGLVGFWTLDSTTETDYSGAGNTLSTNGSPTSVTGKRSKALDYLKSSLQYSYCTDANCGAELDYQGGGFTAMAWIKADSFTGTYNDFLAKDYYNSSTDNGGYIIYTQDVSGTDYIKCALRNSSGTATSVAVDSGVAASTTNWQHVVCTYDGSTISLYVDGQLKSSAGYSGGIKNNTNIFAVGCHSSAADCWDGKIDHVKVYQRCLDSEEIFIEYAYDEKYGYLISMDPANDWVSGKFNNALDFDGTNDCVVVNNQNIEETFEKKNYTVSFWGYLDSTHSAYDMFAQTKYGAGKAYGIYQRTNDGNNQLYLGGVIYNGSTWYGISGDNANYAISYNQWFHYALVKNNTTAYIYIDGKSVGSFSCPSTLDLPSDAEFYIGAHGGGSSHQLEGKMDEVKIYNYALTESQVELDYNNSAAVGFR